MDREALGRGGRGDETRVQVFVAENDNGDDFCSVFLVKVQPWWDSWLMLVKRKIDPGCQKSIFYQENVFFCLHDRQCKCLFELSTVTIFLLFAVETFLYPTRYYLDFAVSWLLPCWCHEEEGNKQIEIFWLSARVADCGNWFWPIVLLLQIRPWPAFEFALPFPSSPLSCQIWTKPSDLRFDTPMSRIIFLRGEFQEINNTSRSASKIVMTYKKDAR